MSVHKCAENESALTSMFLLVELNALSQMPSVVMCVLFVW